MSPKIGFALFLFGCAILALVNAERPYPPPPNHNARPNQYSTQTVRNGYIRTVIVPGAPGAGGKQCLCPCANGSSGDIDNHGSRNDYQDADDAYPDGPTHSGNDEASNYNPKDSNRISTHVKIVPRHE